MNTKIALSSIFLVASVLFLFQCAEKGHFATLESLKVPVPEDNLMDARKIALGKTLFFDKRLSQDESVSCATCHIPEKAFTDGKTFPDGVKGRKATRNAPTLLNIAYSPRFMFDGEVNTLEKQVLVPIQEHNEMGMDMRTLISKLRTIPFYVEEAKAVFNREFDPFTLTRSIAAYERTLVAMDSPFDRFYYRGDKNALSKEAKAGWKLFSKSYCIKCHSLPFFTTHQTENNGLTTLKDQDKGRFRIKGDTTDIGKFKVPTLRNIGLTAPYMHDGRFATLDEVLDHYQRGATGEKIYGKNPIILPFVLSEKERNNLKAFLLSLTEADLGTKFRE